MADAIIGVGFFVYGEIFFLLAGYLLAGELGIAVLPIVWLSAWAGDLISYQMGLRFGKPLLFKGLRRSYTLRKQSYQAMKHLKQKGHWAVFAARFMGPISWITPFLAGVTKIPAGRFALFSLLGVILASAQFIAVGYLLANGINFYDEIIPFIKAYPLPIFFGVTCLMTSVYLVVQAIKKKSWQLHKPLLQLITVWLIGFGVMNYSYFFMGNAHSSSNIPSELPTEISDLSELKNMHLKVYAGEPQFNSPQPINLVLITNRSVAEIHQQINWQQNKTFSGTKLSFKTYLGLLKAGQPPVSDLYFNNVPQDYAFQQINESDLVNREHVRWWKAGTTVDGKAIYLGAVSLDNEIELKPYKGILTVLHDIDRNVDNSRESFVHLIQQHLPNATVETLTATRAIPESNKDYDYWTDGELTVIQI